VSKSGSDSNSGTSTNLSFLTIQKAASVMVAGDTCYVLSGTYRETVTPAHSGTSAAPITFAAYPGAIPIVSGADVLNLTWSLYSNSIYMATTTSEINQLFVDGYMMNIARWPNATVDQLLYAPRSIPTSVTPTSLTDTHLPTNNVNLVGAYMQFFPDEYGNPGYEALTRQITTWSPSTRTFGWSGSVSNGTSFYQTDNYYYVYGALCLLDIPTEWYYSSFSNTLYLWCADNATPANHIVETKNRTSAFTLDNLSYVTVNGLFVFGAGISMANTTQCVVNNCNLIYVQHNMTADWTKDVPIANQVSGTGSMWINSVIDYSSQDGIRLSGQNEMVSNCVISNVDYYPGTYYAGVTAYSGGNGSTIVDNTLWYSGRYCVGVSSTAANVATNDLGYGDLLTSDGGGTYVYTGGGNGNGTQIHHNWVHNCWAGVYVDQNQNNYNIYFNVCYSNDIGLLFNEFVGNKIVNNTSIANTADDIQCNGSVDTNVQFINNLWDTSRNSFSANTIVVDDGWYPPVGANFVLSPGSAGIHGGEYYTNSPIVVSGYSNGPPDIGAYQNGVTWTPGANFVPQPFPLPPSGTNVPPGIATEPSSLSVSAGQTAMFTVAVTGTTPLYLQWRGGAHNSGVFTNLIGGGGQYSTVTNANFYITNVATGNAGDYDVVVTNAFGSVTSSVAVLTVRGLNLTYETTILTDHPTSYWPLNEASGTVIHDLAGTNNGTCMNTSGLTLGGPGVLTTDAAIYFTNTIGGYINVPYSSTLNTPHLTVEAWLNMPSFPVSGADYNMNPVTMDNAPAPNGWAFEITNPNASNPPMWGWLASSGWTQVNSGTCIQGQWAYYAMTYDGTTFSVYTNGVLAGSHASAYSQVSSGFPLYMGAYNDAGTADRFYEGGMQNVAVYSNALTANRILAHYMVGAFTSPVISVQKSGANVIVMWNHGFLQKANSLNGSWTYVTNAVSPYTSSLTNTVTALYFRATLLPSGQ